MRSANDAFAESHHLSAQFALRRTQSIVSIALSVSAFSTGSFTYVSMSSEYTSAWMFSIAIWKP